MLLLAAALLACSAEGSRSPDAERPTYSVAEQTFETDVGTLTPPGALRPRISETEAVQEAKSSLSGTEPAQVATMFALLTSNAPEAAESLPVWVVSLQGGGVCVPNLAGQGKPESSPCLSDHREVVIDAETGKRLLAFSVGTLPDGSGAPVPVADILTAS